MKKILNILLLMSVLLTIPFAHAVIILDSTYQKYGFEKAEALAHEPQFKSLIFISDSASGAWIGNDDGHGYVLSAGHVFDDSTKPEDFIFRTLDGTKYKADKIILHPLWNGNTNDRTGFDFAIIRLAEEVTTAGEQPYLYDGTQEEGKRVTFLGYGYRGTGEKGQDTNIDTHNKPAGGVGLVESVVEAKDPVPKTGDAGNYFGIWLPKEDGSVANPIKENGITEPVSETAGILGSGDSGGPVWIETDSGWEIAGVNSNGGGNAEYGKASWFPRLGYVKEWILSLVPTAQFRK